MPVRKIVPNVIVPALTGGEVLVYGDGEPLMDMIYVIEAGRGKELTPSINELVDNVVAQVGNPACKVRHVPMRGGEPERSVVIGDPRTMAPLGITVGDMVSLDDGIAKAIAWYRAHIKEFA